jgi:hypothetical protein
MCRLRVVDFSVSGFHEQPSRCAPFRSGFPFSSQANHSPHGLSAVHPSTQQGHVTWRSYFIRQRSPVPQAVLRSRQAGLIVLCYRRLTYLLVCKAGQETNAYHVALHDRPVVLPLVLYPYTVLLYYTLILYSCSMLVGILQRRLCLPLPPYAIGLVEACLACPSPHHNMYTRFQFSIGIHRPHLSSHALMHPYIHASINASISPISPTSYLPPWSFSMILFFCF